MIVIIIIIFVNSIIIIIIIIISISITSCYYVSGVGELGGVIFGGSRARRGAAGILPRDLEVRKLSG